MWPCFPDECKMLIVTNTTRLGKQHHMDTYEIIAEILLKLALTPINQSINKYDIFYKESLMTYL